MSPDPCVCFIRGCQNEAPAGCWLCDACFERYAKDDPRTPIGIAPPVNITFRVTSNATPADLAKRVADAIEAQCRARHPPIPPDAA